MRAQTSATFLRCKLKLDFEFSTSIFWAGLQYSKETLEYPDSDDIDGGFSRLTRGNGCYVALMLAYLQLSCD